MNKTILFTRATSTISDVLEHILEDPFFDSADLSTSEKDSYEQMILAVQRLTGLLPTKDLEV